MESIPIILIVLFVLFLIGLPFVLVYRWISSKSKNRVDTSKVHNGESDILNKAFFSFMKKIDFRLGLNEEKKQEILVDLGVLLNEGYDLIKKELIIQGFPKGTKIIDITYFDGLSEHGFTITTFLVQSVLGSEIREVTMNINLSELTTETTGNDYFSSGKEKYYYLKREEGLSNPIMKNSREK